MRTNIPRSRGLATRYDCWPLPCFPRPTLTMSRSANAPGYGLPEEAGRCRSGSLGGEFGSCPGQLPQTLLKEAEEVPEASGSNGLE